jgi:hypothetical protein
MPRTADPYAQYYQQQQQQQQSGYPSQQDYSQQPASSAAQSYHQQSHAPAATSTSSQSAAAPNAAGDQPSEDGMQLIMKAFKFTFVLIFLLHALARCFVVLFMFTNPPRFRLPEIRKQWEQYYIQLAQYQAAQGQNAQQPPQ